jgi:hypothetical protein
MRFVRPAILALSVSAFGFMAPSRAAEPFTVLATLVDEWALAGAHDVELQGRHAYVCGKGGSLAVIDVADPAQPRIVWSRNDPEAINDAEVVLPLGDLLFLGSRDFSSLDIRDPTQPKFLRTLVDRQRIDRLNGFAGRGPTIFGANKEGRIVAFDVSSPDRPTLLGSLDVEARDGIGKPHDVDWLGDLLVVVDPAGFGRRPDPGQVGVYRVFAPETGAVLPPEQWSLVAQAASPAMVGGNRVRTIGRFVFVASSISPQAVERERKQPGVTVIDFTTLDRPKVVAKIPFPDDRGPNGMCVAGSVVFAAGGQTILAIDASDPAHAVRAAAMRCTDVFRGEAGRDDGHDLAYRDGYLYVTGQTTHSFGVLRVDDAQIRAAADRRL